MGHDREDYDDTAWERTDQCVEQGRYLLRRRTFVEVLETLTTEKLGKPAKYVRPIEVGGFHALYRMQLDGSSDDALVRVPLPGSTKFDVEKTPVEVATASYIKMHTSIPIPNVFDYGVTNLTTEVTCFIILQRIEARRSLDDAVSVHRADLDEPMILDLQIPQDVLMKLWVQVARCLLQLSRHQFSRIGSLAKNNNSYTIASRPLTFNMLNMATLANIPLSIFPPHQKTYQTADEWYIALADMHLSQLVFQHNDVVSSRDDCLNKYVARQIFRKLAMKGQLSIFGFAEDTWSAQSEGRRSQLRAPSASGEFRLWCDDLRPSNVLLDSSDKIAAFIDWEFAYAAPTQFTLDPPWWLLLVKPENWDSGVDGWEKVYEEKLQVWLKAMEEAEKMEGSHANQLHLSAYMRESWEAGRFWVNYAARVSWAFDAIYWKYLDERFFGARGGGVTKHELWKTRVHLLSDNERQAMESFVETKMAESKERVLVDWDPEQVRERWNRVSMVDL